MEETTKLVGVLRIKHENQTYGGCYAPPCQGPYGVGAYCSLSLASHCSILLLNKVAGNSCLSSYEIYLNLEFLVTMS